MEITGGGETIAPKKIPARETCLKKTVLGDPGAVSRVDKMFVLKVFCKIETSPWALLPNQFQKRLNCLLLIGQKKFFFGQSAKRELPGDSRVFLHDVVFLIDRDSCVALSTGKVSRGKFQNKMLTTRKIATFSTATRNKHSPMNF